MPHFVAPDGTRLHYEDEGTGLPLLCLAGLTRNSRDFDFVAPALSGVRMIRMDYRGRGLSDWSGPAGYTIPQEAADALALLDHLGIEKAALLGTSRGGLIAMALGLSAKDRLLGVAFNDIGPVVEPAGLAAIGDYLGVVPDAATIEEVARTRLADPDFPGVPLQRWIDYSAVTLEETPEGLKLRYDARLREAVFPPAPDTPAPATEPPDPWSFFAPLLELPVAVIHGENSDILSAATAAEMARRHPNLLLTTLPDRGHIPFLDEPAATDTLLRWLERLQ
ncbi:alpha/beta hydrolase [Pseudooceanicola sp. CBS1P-1]|uniref:Alpha/beta fold hydrolase n=1 Tax=Pseudooceanicola albus TaxID=2692189 RepID=A0A6L7GC32_9RHOB|nr:MULTISPECIES: alpha/beta hydrolase [Pseudooceanicola]MBT9384513.1 alpha/beta hydrolase [Pseudooceanicola endophyticus]MXN21108.1 alpha/beta fold hydrolase [Pseudooceanicola albus]